MSLLDIFSDSSTILLLLNAVLYAKYILSKDLTYKYFAIYLILMAVNQSFVTIFFELEIDNTFHDSSVYFVKSILLCNL